jgi:hypothetical protein
MTSGLALQEVESDKMVHTLELAAPAMMMRFEMRGDDEGAQAARTTPLNMVLLPEEI